METYSKGIGEVIFYFPKILCYELNVNVLFNRYNIKVEGISSDADARLLSSMKVQTSAMLQSNPVDLINESESTSGITFIQDIEHLKTKIRNRMLKSSISLPMGKEQVSVAHLKVLISTTPKEVHGLVQHDINPEDRQNVRSLEKCFNDRVLNALESKVDGSESTIMYLKICREMHLAFTDTSMKPLDRVKLMWHATYFIRAWRIWISESVNYCLHDNFITQPAYSCVELNAYGLLHLIKKFKSVKKPELFLTMLFSSQTCETTFRTLRSMTSIFWTRINFSMLELIHMVGRLELSNEIVYDKLSSNVNFPRVQNRKDKCTIYDLPTNEEIEMVLKEAKSSALSDAARLGMDVDACKIDHSGFKNCIRANPSPESSDLESDDDEQLSFLQHNILVQEKSNDTKYIEIKEKDGSVRTILKSSAIWALTETKNCLSKDRLTRVQSPHIRPNTPRSTPSSKSSARKRRMSDTSQENYSKRKKESEPIHSAEELTVGDLALFRSNSQMVDNYGPGCVLGMILGFRYIKGRTEKDKQYTLDSVPISAENTSNRGVEVLATWKNIDENFQPNSFPGNSIFLNINSYIATIKMTNNFKLQNFSNEIETFLEEKNSVADSNR